MSSSGKRCPPVAVGFISGRKTATLQQASLFRGQLSTDM